MLILAFKAGVVSLAAHISIFYLAEIKLTENAPASIFAFVNAYRKHAIAKSPLFSAFHTDARSVSHSFS